MAFGRRSKRNSADKDAADSSDWAPGPVEFIGSSLKGSTPYISLKGSSGPYTRVLEPGEICVAQLNDRICSALLKGYQTEIQTKTAQFPKAELN